MKKANYFDIKRAIQYIALFLCFGMIFVLTEANSKLLGSIVDAGAFSNWFKAFIYGSAAMIIIVYYRQMWIKALFVVMDMAIIWVVYESWIYPIYSGLILFGIGKISTDLYTEIRVQAYKSRKRKVQETKIIEAHKTELENLKASFEVTKENLAVENQKLGQKLKLTEETLASKNQSLKRSEAEIEKFKLSKQIINLKKGGKTNEPKIIELEAKISEIDKVVNQ